MHDTRGLERMAQEPMPIRSQSAKHKRLFTLMNRVDALSLLTAHDRQSAKKAVGIDGITKEAYGEKIFDNLLDLACILKVSKNQGGFDLLSPLDSSRMLGTWKIVS